MISAVFDTTVWVAAFRTSRGLSASRIILDACLAGHVQMVLSRELLHENVSVLLRPALGIDSLDALKFGAFLATNSKIVAISGEPQGCSDPDDDMLLETARKGGARYLVSYDRGVLALSFVQRAAQLGVEIVSHASFLEILRNQGIVTKNEVVPLSKVSRTKLNQWLDERCDAIRACFDQLVALERERPDESDEPEMAAYLLQRDGIREALKAESQFLDRVAFKISPVEALKRFQEAAQAKNKRGALEAELILERTHKGERDQDFIVLDDVDPMGALQRYADADVELRGIEALTDEIKRKS